MKELPSLFEARLPPSRPYLLFQLGPSIMSTSSLARPDMAHTVRQRRIDTQHAARACKKIIRIRTDEPMDSKQANLTLSIVDDTGAGQSWSTKETGIHQVSKTEVVLLVGELLPKDTADLMPG